MGTLANSADPDEMPHYVALHQGLHCFLWPTSFFTERYRIPYMYNISLQIIACDPSMYTLVQSDFIVCSIMENSIDVEKVKTAITSSAGDQNCVCVG